MGGRLHYFIIARSTVVCQYYLEKCLKKILPEIAQNGLDIHFLGVLNQNNRCRYLGETGGDRGRLGETGGDWGTYLVVAFIDATSNAFHWQDEVNTDYGSGLRVLLELESLATNFSTKRVYFSLFLGVNQIRKVKVD